MKNNFFKLNMKYIENFSTAVMKRYREENIRSQRTFLKSLFKELNRLFTYIGGRVSSKNDIPKATDYPDSQQFNKLIEDIAIDIDKVFTAEKLLEDDVNNLLNYNSSQRLKTFESLSQTQQKVYNIYIKNKKLIGGEIVIPADNPFSNASNTSEGSTGVKIDETRGILTLSCDSSVVKPVDLENVQMYFSSNVLPDKFRIFPNNKVLSYGSHWKIPGVPVSHHFDIKSQSELNSYRTMLIDDPNSNVGVGWCEFESVITFVPANVTSQEQKLMDIKREIGHIFVKDPEHMFVDIPNSLQGQYITDVDPGQREHKYKLVVPFNGAPLTNEIDVVLQPNSNGYYPKINYEQSKVFTNTGGTDSSYAFIKPSTELTENGEYKLVIAGGFIKPTRAEIIFEYSKDSEQWIPFAWYMSHYVYHATKNYVLSQGDTETISLILRKTYDIFVDAEANKEKEQSRALNVLLLKG